MWTTLIVLWHCNRETLGTGIHLDAMRHTIVERVLPLMVTVLPDGSEPWRSRKTDQDWLEGVDKELKASTWPPNFPDPSLVGHLLDMLEQVRSGHDRASTGESCFGCTGEPAQY